MTMLTKVSMKQLLAIVLSVAVLIGISAFPIASEAASSTVRVATVTAVKGTVEVKKAGGKRYFKAYKNMPLNEGDHLQTGKESSVTLKVQDRSDEVVIGEKSSLYLSELRDSEGGKKSKFLLWTGSLWVKATSLVSTTDEFEVETPTAVMGVRGTTLYVSVDPVTGEQKFLILSGKGVVEQKLTSEQRENTVLYPASQVSIFKDSAPISSNAFVDLDNLMSGMSMEILEQIIRSKKDIDREHDEFIEVLRNSTSASAEQQSISMDGQAYEKNLNQLINSMLKEFINQQPEARQWAEELVKQVNSELDTPKKISLADDLELATSDKDKASKNKLEELRKRQQEEQEKREQSKKEGQQKSLLEQLEKERERLAEENRLKQEAARKKAEQDYLNRMKEEEKKRYEQDKQKLEGGEAPAPSAAPGNSSEPETPSAPSSPLNQAGPGPVRGPIEQTVSGSTNQTFGPASSPALQVDGTVTIRGNGSGTYTLRNLHINGDLIVDIPLGSLYLDSSVQVSGGTQIIDVAPGTFVSAATHQESIFVSDSNGSRLQLTGAASEANVFIEASGEVSLAGRYNETVYVTGQNVTLTLEPGTKIWGKLMVSASGLVIVAPEEGMISKVVVEGGIVLDRSVQFIIDHINDTWLDRMNGATTVKQVVSVLGDRNWYEISDWHAEQILAARQLRPSGQFASYAEALEIIEQVLLQAEPPLDLLANPGVVDGPVVQEIRADGQTQFGPSGDEPLIIKGNLRVEGNGSDSYQFNNLIVEGDFFIDLPQAYVSFGEQMQVNGEIVIEELGGSLVIPEGSEEQAIHLVVQTNESQAITVPSSAQSELLITGTGGYELAGNYKLVRLSGEASEVRALSGTVIYRLEVEASNMEAYLADALVGQVLLADGIAASSSLQEKMIQMEQQLQLLQEDFSSVLWSQALFTEVLEYEQYLKQHLVAQLVSGKVEPNLALLRDELLMARQLLPTVVVADHSIDFNSLEFMDSLPQELNRTHLFDLEGYEDYERVDDLLGQWLRGVQSVTLYHTSEAAGDNVSIPEGVVLSQNQYNLEGYVLRLEKAPFTEPGKYYVVINATGFIQVCFSINIF